MELSCFIDVQPKVKGEKHICQKFFCKDEC